MRNGFKLRLELNDDQKSNIADLIFDMRKKIAESDLMPSLFSDEDFLRMAIFAWTEKETKNQKRKK